MVDGVSEKRRDILPGRKNCQAMSCYGICPPKRYRSRYVYDDGQAISEIRVEMSVDKWDFLFTFFGLPTIFSVHCAIMRARCD